MKIYGGREKGQNAEADGGGRGPTTRDKKRKKG